MFVEEKRSGEEWNYDDAEAFIARHFTAGRIEMASMKMRQDTWFSPANSRARGYCPEQALSGGEDNRYELAMVTKAADLIFPAPASYGGNWLSPQRFNDYPGRTLSDVHLVMDVAAEMVRHER